MDCRINDMFIVAVGHRVTGQTMSTRRSACAAASIVRRPTAGPHPPFPACYFGRLVRSAACAACARVGV